MQPEVMFDRHEMYVSVYQLFRCVGEALDLVHPHLVDHHKRTAVVAARIADEMSLPPEERENVILAALIHDAGAFTLRQRLDVISFDSEDVMPHCTLGYQLLVGCPSLGGIAETVRHHHVHWADRRDKVSSESTAPRTSHLLHLADRAAVSIDRFSEPLGLGREVVKQIRRSSGKMLSPELVQVFEQVAARPAFWFDVTSRRIGQVLDGLWCCRSESSEAVALSEIEHLFSRIIDFRSRFTASHSAAVATIAESIAWRMGLEGTSRLLRAAGHFHDLGKLCVPVEILEKPAPFTSEERSLIIIHPYHTFQILREVGQLDEVNMWASYHHECLDGSGYPFCLKSEDLPEEARILAVADRFIALSEDRPYRPALLRSDVVRMLDGLAKNSKLDRAVVALVIMDYDDLDAQHREVRKRLAADYSNFAASPGASGQRTLSCL